MPEAEQGIREGSVGDCNRVIVKVAKGGVCLTHQDHGSYFIPPYEARSVALRLLRAADQADLNQAALNDGSRPEGSDALFRGHDSESSRRLCTPCPSTSG